MKKILSVLLCVSLCLGVVMFTILAAEADPEEEIAVGPDILINVEKASVETQITGLAPNTPISFQSFFDELRDYVGQTTTDEEGAAEVNYLSKREFVPGDLIEFVVGGGGLEDPLRVIHRIICDGDCVYVRVTVIQATRFEEGVYDLTCAICGDVVYTGILPVLTIGNATTTTKDFVSMQETSKNSRTWVLSFNVTLHLADEFGVIVAQEVVTYSVTLSGNNANLDGRFTFGADHDLAGRTLTYDIKGNGSNIKALSLSS